MTTEDPQHPVVQRSAPAIVGARPMAGLSRTSFERRMGAFEEAVGKVVAVERHAAALRMAEAERRIASLEARISEIEGAR